MKITKEALFKAFGFIDIPLLNTDKISEYLIEKYCKTSNGDFPQYKLTVGAAIPIKCVLVFKSQDEILKGKEIIDRVSEKFGVNKTSIMPNDYTDDNVKFSKYKLLTKVDRGIFKLSKEGKEVWNVSFSKK